MNKTMRNNFKRVRDFTSSLAYKVEHVLPEMEDTLNGKSKLPKGCPSKEAMAGLSLREIESQLVEISSAVADIKKALHIRPELN